MTKNDVEYKLYCSTEKVCLEFMLQNFTAKRMLSCWMLNEKLFCHLRIYSQKLLGIAAGSSD